MIVVFVEMEGGTVSEVSLETVTLARSLSAAGGGVPVDAVALGALPDEAVADLRAYGVRHVLHASGPAFDSWSGAAAATAVAAARDAAGAVVVTAAGTTRGNEVLAHVAARLDVAMAAQVLSFGGLAPFSVTRQVVGGAALEEVVLGRRPAVFTVAGHAVRAEPAATPGAAEVRPLAVEVPEADLVARAVDVEVRTSSGGEGLKDAKVVVGAGRGAGGPEGFDSCLELAHLLGGQLGVSRVVTSLGWRPHHEQVGQTGTRIAPDVYIACGISGAIQHWAGCASSKTIIAVNTDAEAPMVTKATYAVIGDMHEVVPALVEELKR
jgi:electron transfer flavoprotein alpha subunit